MVNEKIREQLPKGATIFDNEAYDESIVGVTIYGEVIYSYEKMIYEYMDGHSGCSYEQAQRWVDENTMAAMRFMPSPRPIIMDHTIGGFFIKQI